MLEVSECNDIITDAPFGFYKPHYGTRDAIFALYSIISNSLCNRKDLYRDFFDLRKGLIR